MRVMLSKLAAAAVCLAVLGFPRAADAVQTIPFTDANGLIAVQGSVDGRPPVQMLVDLGAGVDILSERLAGLVAFNGKYSSMRLTGERLDLPMGNIVTLDAGGVRLDDLRVGVWNGLYAARGVDGLISAVAFRSVVTTFDFANHQIVLEDAVSFPERRRTATRIPLVLQDDLDTSLGLFARFDLGNGRSGLCEIDTGIKGILVDKVFEAGGVPSIALDGAPQTAMNKPQVTFENLIYDCIVGNQFWADRSFTLDILNRAMYVGSSIAWYQTRAIAS